MNIAIVQLGRIGDLILVTSAINIIKNKYPDAKIDFIVGASNYFIIKDNPNIARVLVFDKNPIKLIPFIFKLRSKLYDFYIDPKDHHSTESNILARLSNSIIKVGFNDDKKKKNKSKKRKIFDISIPNAEENCNLHFIERIDNIFSLIGFNSLGKSNRPNLFIPQTSLDYIKNYLEQNKITKYIIINISASNDNRMWLEDKWIEFINIIKKNENNLQIILISEAKHFTQAQNISNKTSIIHLNPTTLTNIAALIRNSNLLISPDTSLIHIASAFNIPVIALTNNIAWNIIKFAPLSSSNIIIFPKNDMFVKYIPVENVIEAFNSMKKY